MNNFNKDKEDNIDIGSIVAMAKAHWYYFAISLFAFLALAYVYNRYVEPSYSVSATLLFDNIRTGSTNVGELIDDGNGGYRKPENTLLVENEISIIKTDNLIHQVVHQLDYNVIYYKTEKFWPDFIETNWLHEVYGDFPMTIVLDSTANQPLNVPIKAEIISSNQVLITLKAKKANVYNFAKEVVVRELEDVSFEQVVTVGEPLVSDFLNITVLANEETDDFSDFNLFFEIKNDNSLTKKLERIFDSRTYKKVLRKVHEYLI